MRFDLLIKGGEIVGAPSAREGPGNRCAAHDARLRLTPGAVRQTRAAASPGRGLG